MVGISVVQFSVIEDAQDWPCNLSCLGVVGGALGVELPHFSDFRRGTAKRIIEADFF
jgi:hypothetical protein